MTTYTISQPYAISLNIGTGDKLTMTAFGSVSVNDAGPLAGLVGAGADTVQIDGYLSDNGASRDGLLLNGVNNVVGIGAGGSIYGSRYGLNAQGGSLALTISGQLLARQTALLLGGTGNTVNVTATGRLQSNETTIASGGGGNLTVNNAGLISSITSAAIQASGTGSTINNSGVITTGDGICIFFANQASANTMNNSGVIRSASLAVGSNGALALVNTGTIDGYRGLQLTPNGPASNNIYNSGYIFGRVNEAIACFNINVTDTVINDGFLQGGAGTCVSLNQGNDAFDGRNGLQFGGVNGGGGDDTLFGGTGNDFLYGSDDNDQLSGGGAGDYLDGGNGFDYARYDTGGAVTASLATPAANTGDAAGDTYVSIEGLIGSNAGDLLVGDAGPNTLFGLGGMDGIAGGDGNDTIYGGDGGDSIAGQAGNDVIYGGAGGDVLSGGAGGDVFAYSSLADGGDFIADFNAGGVRDSFDIRAIFDATGYMGTTPRATNILQVLQNGADTDVYVYATFLFRTPNLYAPALDDTYFTFQ